MAEDNLASYRTSAEAELSSFQTGWVEVKFREKPILVSRRTFSEVAKWGIIEIIYTTSNDKKEEEKVIVSFNQTAKIYEILYLPSPNSTTNSSPIKIDPATEEGQAWIQCLQEAYPYYDFENAKILNKYKYYEHLLDSFPILLPKVIERADDKLSAFSQTETVSLWYSRISYEELEKSFPRLFWFDPYSHTHYTLLFDPESGQYELIYRYRKERSLYIVILRIQVVDANTGHVSLVKTIIKQTKAPKPGGPTANQTPTSEENDQDEQTKQNQVATIAPDILDSLTKNIISVLNLTESKGHSRFVQAVIAQMMETLPSTDILKNHSNKEYIEQFFENNKIPILNKLFPRDSTPEETAGLRSKGKHPELTTLINLFHSAFPNYDFSRGKVKNKK